eukprot:SAG11_NODE_1887_length_4116_cov_8.004730_4_plen_118_part_00
MSEGVPIRSFSCSRYGGRCFEPDSSLASISTTTRPCPTPCRVAAASLKPAGARLAARAEIFKSAFMCRGAARAAALLPLSGGGGAVLSASAPAAERVGRRRACSFSARTAVTAQKTA